MRSYPRIHTVVKYGGLVFALFIIIFAALSRSASLSVAQRTTTRLRYLSVSQGIGAYLSIPMSNLPQADPAQLMWRVRTPATTPRLRWWPVPGKPPGTTEVECPLWILALASLLVSVTAWRLDTLAERRVVSNKCTACSYDRSGLPQTAPCPECGASSPA